MWCMPRWGVARWSVTWLLRWQALPAPFPSLAFDACMFNSQNFGFVKLPDDCTTGSSIMPHKKNPDVFELTRAKCNKLQSLAPADNDDSQ